MSSETKVALDPPGLRSLSTIAVYTAAIFLSAALLFAVQPMFTKIVLPRFGGAPSVWAVAMVFFQGVLLLGYAYADLLTRLGGPRVALPLHLGVMVAGAMALPLAIPAGWGMPPSGHEALFLIGLFTTSIGVPFFALSANGPLLQAWFARSGHPDASNPYFLYAASNVGSLLALFAYPFIAEPLSTLSLQGEIWRVGYLVLIALIGGCGALAVFARGTNETARSEHAEAAPTLPRMALWVALAFVPSALMVAVTTHITTDIAAAPFLWVLPLALYLVTFILVFSDRTWIPQRWLLASQPVLTALVVLNLALDIRSWLTIDVTLHMLFFFVTAMICHGQLSTTRPAAAHLTRFYFCLSLGGVLGGTFSGLVAPNVFAWIAEYPILIVAAMLARPGLMRPRLLEGALYTALALLIVLVVAPGIREAVPVVPPYNALVWACAIVLTIAAALLLRWRPLGAALLIAAVFLVTRVYPPNVRQLETVRSFFGVHKIEVTPDGHYRTLRHGMELHGAQRITTDDGKPVTGAPELTTYYHRKSPIAEVIRAVQARTGGSIDMAVIGLGAGLMACLARPEDRLDYYEIDADIVTIARDPKRFRFLHDCKPDANIILGDARLTLAANARARYDVIHMDAFSSDSIPVHLLTREALRVYLSRLKPGGIILTHISNNHLDLSGVVAATAAAEGLVWRIWDEDEVPGADSMIRFSTVMILARSTADFGTLNDWDTLALQPGQRAWTDDESSLLGPLIRKFRQGD
ncbi:hypothetical protein X566_20510 [Afipia sp. P52-10]|uniref:fused MFS/spermidine synthase n=1 Tax=Afipia sp. P52-10 TaxID=1429916 RepID=UPI0003DF1539|nr:fused MFS/spermidine synthase [Afipia sp. P52-10]ETR75122.1 hypothetical protein X566_20510 [Afipia sp. P52-10]